MKDTLSFKPGDLVYSVPTDTFYIVVSKSDELDPKFTLISMLTYNTFVVGKDWLSPNIYRLII